MMEALLGVSKSLILNPTLHRIRQLNRGMRRKRARPHHQQSPPHPVSPMPVPNLLLRFNGRSALSKRDRIADVEHLTIVVEAAAAIVAGSAKAAGVAGSR